MDERRKENKEFFGEIKAFIDESRVYRATDELTQKYQADNLEAVKVAIKIQNGRIFKLEKWQSFILGAGSLLGVIGTFLSILALWIKK